MKKKKQHPKKKKMGRPPIGNPKDTTLTIRLTTKDKVRLKKAARAEGMCLAEYIMAPHRTEKE